MTRTNALSLGFVVLSFGAAAALYGHLPDPVPSHWNSGGEPDGFMAKPWGAFVLPLVMAGVYMLLACIPRVSPRGFRVGRFREAFGAVQVAVLAFLALVSVLALLAATGVTLSPNRVIHTALGLLFIVIGNYMSKFTRNFLVGIRTPWTLASDEVWLRTHRLGGRLFVLAGLVLVVSGMLGGGRSVVLTAVGIAAGIPAVYSYVVYRRIETLKNGSARRESSHPS